MSRIGKKPIPIPSGVKVNIAADAIEVQGPKNTICGTASGAGNLVSGNGSNGLLIGCSSNQVLGNSNGTTIFGS